MYVYRRNNVLLKLEDVHGYFAEFNGTQQMSRLYVRVAYRGDIITNFNTRLFGGGGIFPDSRNLVNVDTASHINFYLR
jgi:hypothetical protein